MFSVLTLSFFTKMEKILNFINADIWWIRHVPHHCPCPTPKPRWLNFRIVYFSSFYCPRCAQRIKWKEKKHFRIYKTQFEVGELMVRAKMQLESPGLWASFMSVWFSWSSRRLSGLLQRSIIVLSLTAQFGRWESVKMTTKAKATATACCLFEFLLSGLAHGHCCCYGWASWRVSSVQHALIIARFIFTHCSWLADEETKATTPPVPSLLPFVCVGPDWTKNLMRLRVFWLCHSSLAASLIALQCCHYEPS